MTRSRMFNEMLLLQDTFNSRLDGNWRQRNWDWESCITVEIGEALESLQFKHWKEQDLDLENAKVELIDILHFHLSKDLEVFARVTVLKYLEKYFNYEPLEVSIEDMRLSLNEYNQYRSMSNLANMFKDLGMSVKEIYKRYVIKNVLNTFRQDNGYKDNTYIKVWNGVEDNKVALTLWRDDDTYDTIYEKLEDKYNEIKD